MLIRPSQNITPYLDLIRDSSNKLDRFIRDIIDYSRNARLKIDTEVIDFEKLINASFSNLNFIPNASRLKKCVEIINDVPFFGDATRLNVIFNNLFSNNIKYQNTDISYSYVNIEITISEDSAHIIIEDNGLGIDPAYKDRIFDMFYRASSLSKGTGLGLYIVKETIARLKGTIEVESEFGKGTTFILNIPNNSKKRAREELND